MAILAINTAAASTSIALIEKGAKNFKILAERSWEDKNNEAEKLMPEIFGMIKKSGKSFKDIKEIFCIKGPGSFTGLRIGVTVANTMRYLLGAKLYAMDYFEYLWTRAPKSPDQSDKKFKIKRMSTKSVRQNPAKTALLIYAGKGGVYVSLSPKENFEKDVKNINIHDLAKFLKSKKVEKVFGDIIPEQKKFLGKVKFLENFTKSAKLKPGAKFKNLSEGGTKEHINENPTFGKAVAEIFEDHFSGKKTLKEVKVIKPVYIKKPGITMSKSKIF